MTSEFIAKGYMLRAIPKGLDVIEVTVTNSDTGECVVLHWNWRAANFAATDSRKFATDRVEEKVNPSYQAANKIVSEDGTEIIESEGLEELETVSSDEEASDEVRKEKE